MNQVLTQGIGNIERFAIKDAIKSFKSNVKGISLYQMHPAMVRLSDSKSVRIHDSNFAFVMTQLAKLHEKTYEPFWNTTYAQDIPIDVGGGLVDYVQYFTVEWAGMASQDNLVGNNVNVIPQVNAGLQSHKADVYTFEVAYSIKFIEIDKLNRLNFTKSIEQIYKDAILAGWDLFCDKIAYIGANAGRGLLNNSKIIPQVISQGTFAPTQAGFAAMTDEEIVGTINGIIADFLTNTNNNIKVIPDIFLMSITDAVELSNRISDLYVNNLRRFLEEYNVGKDTAVAEGFENFKIKFRGRPRLEKAGTNGTGRIVAYRYNKDIVRMDIPYQVQLYTTLPNVDRGAYTSIWVGQASDIQLPYNSGDVDDFGLVQYYDFGPVGS